LFFFFSVRSVRVSIWTALRRVFESLYGGEDLEPATAGASDVVSKRSYGASLVRPDLLAKVAAALTAPTGLGEPKYPLVKARAIELLQAIADKQTGRLRARARRTEWTEGRERLICVHSCRVAVCRVLLVAHLHCVCCFLFSSCVCASAQCGLLWCPIRTATSAALSTRSCSACAPTRTQPCCDWRRPYRQSWQPQSHTKLVHLSNTSKAHTAGTSLPPFSRLRRPVLSLFFVLKSFVSCLQTCFTLM